MCDDDECKAAPRMTGGAGGGELRGGGGGGGSANAARGRFAADREDVRLKG
jgi:hypothetical protein